MRTSGIGLGLLAVIGSVAWTACATGPTSSPSEASVPGVPAPPPSPDPRIGLEPGFLDAGEATWNLRVLSSTPPPEEFVGGVNTDLAFTGTYAIQGNFDGLQIWDIANPFRPRLVKAYVCPAAQSDVSVYENLLFVSAEDFRARLDCGTEGVRSQVSTERIRGIRVFDISDIENPRYLTNVQTCRGSHTHSLLADPDDPENVYIYVSGSAPVRPEAELAGCVNAPPSEDPQSALFRIEVIRVPLANPDQAAIVSSPRIFEQLVAPPEHGMSPEDVAALESARERGIFVVDIGGDAYALPSRFVDPLLDTLASRAGRGTPTAADSTELRARLPAMMAEMTGGAHGAAEGPRSGPTQCHDITLYPDIGLASGACEGYGFLIDITDPVDPKRLEAVADSNFSYWHSATFNNDGSAVLFADEWGGGGGAKCRAGDPVEWGANAIFSIANGRMRFRSYYKLPVVQTPEENCTAHNGSLIPIPGRDVTVQAWYQGGISVFDWTDPANPFEMAYFDRGPANPDRMEMVGSWSAYWYNGVIVSSEIARGLDILELVPSDRLTRNELDAARSVRLDYFNAQGQERFVWPPSFSLARAYLDQLERGSGLDRARVAAVRRELTGAEGADVTTRRDALRLLATRLQGEVGESSDPRRMRRLVSALRELADLAP